MNRPLTDALLRKMSPPEAGRIDLTDPGCRGLTFRLTSAGAASWSYRYKDRITGKVARVTLGSYPAITLANARKLADVYRVRVAAGERPQAERTAERVDRAKTDRTFGALADAYLERYAKVRKRSWREDEKQLDRYVLPSWGQREAVDITRRDVLDLLDRIADGRVKVPKGTAKAKPAPIAANRTHALLSRLFSWAVDEERLPASPVVRVKKRAPENPKERFLCDAELAVLWHAVDGLSATVRDGLRLLMLTGQRPGEIAGMARSEITADLWRLPASRMKAKRPHVVPLQPLALEIVSTAAQRAGDSAFILPARRGDEDAHMARHSMSQALGRLINAMPDDDAHASLKADPPSPHDIRRTVATGMASLGVPKEDRRAVLGHVDDDVHATHYDQYDRLPEKRSALAGWEAHVRAVVGLEPAPSNVVPMRGRA